MEQNNTAKVIFQPSGRRGEVEQGITLIEASRHLFSVPGNEWDRGAFAQELQRIFYLAGG